MLHITNGDSAAHGLRAAGVPGIVVPWRDVLHEGPVPADLSLDELSRVRARFLAEQMMGGGSYEDILSGFQERDATLAGWQAHDEVVLWFEHDLYDQLQLLQILDWFAARDHEASGLSLICINSFPGHPSFRGLGELSPAELATLFPTRHRVTSAELSLARAAWGAFRAPNPTALEDVLATDTSALPFLRPALLRHLEEFPSVDNGLSRTDQELLQVIEAGAQAPHAIFIAWQALEEQPFMGDTPLWMHLKALSEGAHSLVTLADGAPFRMPHEMPHEAGSAEQFAAQQVRPTATGQAVFAGQADAAALNGIDRWLGGVHLERGVLWRWQTGHQRLVSE